MGPKKIVLDTNIVISGMGWEGNPHRILLLVYSGEIEWIISAEQLDEIKRVLGYPHLKFMFEQQEKIVSLIQKTATLVQIQEKVTVIIEDPTDNILLETALAGKAEYVVSGDQHLRKIGTFREVRIVTPADFLIQWREIQ